MGQQLIYLIHPHRQKVLSFLIPAFTFFSKVSVKKQPKLMTAGSN